MQGGTVQVFDRAKTCPVPLKRDLRFLLTGVQNGNNVYAMQLVKTKLQQKNHIPSLSTYNAFRPTP